MKRNPHPARRSRIATLGISSTAFVSIVTSLAWNTHQAELAANVADANAVPIETTTPATSATTPPAIPSVSTPTATINPSAPTVAPAKPTKTSAPTVAPATPVVPAAPTTPAVAPAAPATTAVYTCMSPGGKTENPTAAGKCTNARYGYVLTKI